MTIHCFIRLLPSISVSLLWIPIVLGVTWIELTLHASPADCWTVVDDNVYDITNYVPSHPGRGGGPTVVYGMCGQDGTALYDTAHATEHHYLTMFPTIAGLGPIESEVVTTASSTTAATTTTTTTTTSTTTTSRTTTGPTTTLTTTASVPTTSKAIPATAEETNTTTTTPSTTATDPTTTGSNVVPTSKETTTATTILGSTTSSTAIASEQLTSATFLTTTTTSGETNPTESLSATTSAYSLSSYYTLQDVQSHNQPGVDCWVAYHGWVYDMTTYQHPEPVGNSVIVCGTESTQQFAAFHDEIYLSMIDNRLVGRLENSEVETPNTGVTTIEIEQLQAHGSPADCWTVFHGKVYDMTTFAPSHPIAGPEAIWEFCGADGTEAYSIYHTMDLLSTVEKYSLGPFTPGDATECDKGTESTFVARAISHEEVQQHDQTTDCWTIMYDDVYDLTRYRHPGPPPSYGQRIIYDYSCGLDSTKTYASVHPKDLLKKTQMDQFKIGWVVSSASRIVDVLGTCSIAIVAETILVFLS